MGVDFSKLTGFQWDAGNATKSLTKHRVTAQEAESVFADPQVQVLDDVAHSIPELRWKVFGITSQPRYLVVSFTIRDSLIRIISARPMNRRERKIYEQKTNT
jgi:uncharacterized DUF497 family protein